MVTPHDFHTGRLVISPRLAMLRAETAVTEARKASDQAGREARGRAVAMGLGSDW